MSSVERAPKDIFYDMSPFTAKYSCKCGKIQNQNGVLCDFCKYPCAYVGDINARYKGLITTHTREHPFSINQKEYYDLLWNGINNDIVCLQYLEESRFVQNYLPEITNRLCTECDFVKAVESQPSKYKDIITIEECTQQIFKFLDCMFNNTRFGIGERMIDTVTQDNIDIFLSNLVLTASIRLVGWVKTKTADAM